MLRVFLTCFVYNNPHKCKACSGFGTTVLCFYSKGLNIRIFSLWEYAIVKATIFNYTIIMLLSIYFTVNKLLLFQVQHYGR